MEEKKGQKLNILLLDQGRQSLPFLKSFSRAGHNITCVCNTRLSEAYFSRYPSKRLLWPSYVKDRAGFEKCLLDYLRNNQVDVTISVGDVSSDILSRNKNQITKYTNITTPDYTVFVKAADKLNLMSYCMGNGLPCPRTFALTDEIIENLDDLIEFPVIVKPTRGVGAVGLRKFDKPSDLKLMFRSLNDQFGDLIIQEFIPQQDGIQYQAEAFLDEKSRMKVCMIIEKPRYFPVSGGTSTANVTIMHPEISAITKKLLEGLKWKGAADVDFIVDARDKKVKILEINPRVTAGIKIGFAAGIDFADLHLKLALGKEIPEISNYRTGVYCRNFFLEILWFIYSDRDMKRNTKPSFYKLPGKSVVDQLFSLDDPLAGLGFLLNMVRKYSRITAFKNKFRR